MTAERLADWEAAGSLLCFLSESLTTPRWVLALRGNEGWDSQLKLEEYEKDEVVGRMNGKGIMLQLMANIPILMLMVLDVQNEYESRHVEKTS